MAEQDLVNEFFNARNASGLVALQADSSLDPAAAVSGDLPPSGGTPSADLVESFQRGAVSGAAGLSSDLSYMGAAFSSLLGDEQGIADSIENARIAEEFAAIPMEGMQTFGEFLDAPTIEGFLDQVASGTGQIAPSAVSTISGAGVGSIGMLLGKEVLKETSRQAAKNIIKDSLLAVSRKKATPDERNIAQAAYEAAQEAHVLSRNRYLRNQTMKRGAIVGAGVSEFAPLAGSNVSEALESGRDLTPDQAIRAGLIAAPQAAIGVLGEVGLVKLIANKAKAKSAGPQSVMGRLADSLGKGFLKGGAIEGGTELIQEEIAIRNRMDMDDTFTDADANLRRMNALFVGFFGGGAIGGGGSAAAQGVRELSNAGGVVDAAASVTERASEMADSLKERMTKNRTDQETVGETEAGQTSREPARDINAQLLAMVDPTSSKESVWIAGTERDPKYAKTDNKATQIVVNGEPVYSAYITGRGTIISKYADVVDNVVKGQASDQVLQAALGYSNVKTPNDDLVVRVLDRDGDVVSEESTNEANQASAEAAGQALMPEGGSVEVIPIDQALADRKRRADADVKFMEEDEEIDPLEEGQETNETIGDQEFEAETRTYTYRRDGVEQDSYQAVEGDNNFAGIEEAQSAYAEMVGEDIDWSLPFYKRMSKSMLTTARRLQDSMPDEVVNIAVNADGSYRIDIQTTPDTQKIRIRDRQGNEDEVSMSEFLRRSINQAQQSLPKFRTVNITSPGSDTSVGVNPVDLMNAGRRIVEATDGTFTGQGATQSSREGFIAMLGQLQMAGYEVDIKGVPINTILDALADPSVELPKQLANISVGFSDAGKPVRLGFLLKPYVPGAPKSTDVKAVVDGEVKNLSDITDEDGDIRIVSSEEALEIQQDAGPLEPFEIAEENARTPDGIPLTTINIEDVRNVNTTQNRPKGSAPTTNTKQKTPPPKVKLGVGVTFPFGKASDSLTAITRRASARLKLKEPIAIIGLKAFHDKTRTQLQSYLLKQTSLASRKSQEAFKKLDLSNHQAVGAFFQQAQKDGLLKKAISEEVAKIDDAALIGFSIVNRAAFEVISPLTNSNTVAQDISQNLVNVFGDRKKKGFQMSFTGGSVIMVNDLHNNNEAALAMVAAHEMGHILFKEEINGVLENEALYGRLVTAFRADRQKARDEGKPIKQWEDVGFEEWYADKVAAEVKKDLLSDKRGAKNAVDSHFKRIVKRFKQLWFEVIKHPIFRRTNKTNPTFSEYMKEVVKARKSNREVMTSPVYNNKGEIIGYQSGLGGLTAEASDTPQADEIATPKEPSWEQKAVVRAIKQQINIEDGAEARRKHWDRKMLNWGRQFTQDNPNATKILGLLLTSDTMLRMVAGNDFADMFYVRSNTAPGVGFVKARQLARDQWRAELFEILGTDWTTPEIENAFKLAQGKTPTAELDGKAKQIRLYLERLHKEYIAPSNSDIAFRENYYPVLLNLGEIANDPNIFIELILKEDSTADAKKVRQAVKRILRYQQATAEGSNEIDMDEVDFMEPAEAAEASIQLTKNVSPGILRDMGYLQEPEVAILSYLDQVTKRVEWNRHTKTSNGTNKVAEGLAGLSDPQREVAQSVIHAYLGNVAHMSPFWRTANSYAQAMNLVTLLPFAALASIPDFAGSIVATREFNGFAMFGKQIVETMQDREAAKRLANDIGVVMPEAAANAFMSQADSDMLDPKVRMATDKFFKFIGLEALTTFSREIAAGMGKRFLIEHANHPTERSERYLAQLGVTYDQVRRWQDNDFRFEGEDGAAIKAALVRFVESSVLRPNAAERPVWASDPRFALIWQLKSFMYSINKVIVEGVEREFAYRVLSDKSVAASMFPLLAITLAAFMPMAALGLELREWAKVGLSYALPGVEGSFKYLKTNQMDWGTYYAEIFSRTGLDGPLAILTMAQRNADWGGSALASILGPTAELLERTIADGPIDTATSRLNSPTEQMGAILGVGAFAGLPGAAATGIGLSLAGATQ